MMFDLGKGTVNIKCYTINVKAGHNPKVKAVGKCRNLQEKTREELVNVMVRKR